MHMVRESEEQARSEGIAGYTLDELSQLINISGRQRMLSQRLSFLIFAAKNDLNGPFEETFELFEKSHRILRDGNENFPAPQKGSSVYEYFFGAKQADRVISEFISFAKDIYYGRSSDVKGFFELACNRIVPLLNEAVLIYQSLSHEASEQIASNMQLNNENLINTLEEIKYVYKRIKIISVNASIVASQAGRYGEAFNVVVGEIRGLANQIHSLIEEGLKSLKAREDG